MDKIQLVDLKNQYEAIKQEINKAVLDVLSSTAYINGPEVKAFQKELEEYLNVKHVIPCGNGTDALQIALMSLKLKPGDEVITPSFTYVATCEVVSLLGLKPVFVEVDPSTFNLDVDDLKEKITDKTKAVIPVHLYGQCAHMEPIMEVAREHNIAVIEDTAQAIGADYTFKDGKKAKAGTIGHIGTTSFFPSKNLGAYGDGGAIMTNDDETAENLRMIANHGQSKRYYHDQIGVNSRLDSIQAAVLRVKLKHLDSYNESRRKAADFYTQRFEPTGKIIPPKVAPYSTHVYHQYTVKLQDIDRGALQEYLNARNIPNNIYYPLANHKQKAFEAEIGDVDLTVTDELSSCVLSFPIHTELTKEQLEYITSETIDFLK